ncbi:MAG: Gfo/Idh/MocA family oxidoreductase [Treponema sp.]|jgi:predicted dehydrogenase|nr:Gfo/Idh/MocA family oxidoreductase [Treponema sp.]
MADFFLALWYIKRMDTIGIGIIGAGFMGKTHAHDVKTLPLYYADLPLIPRLVGICDAVPSSAKAMKEQNGFDFATSSLDELLARPDIDAVTISTPNVFHRENVLAAFRAGKHVYCDKPLASSYAQALELIEARKNVKRPLVAQVAHQFRCFPAVMRAKQLLEEGRIGKIMSFHGAYLHSGSIDKNKPIGWKQDKTMGGGGVLFDLGSHILDLLYSLLGDFSELFASTRIVYPERPDAAGNRVKIDADDSAWILLKLADGSQGMVEASKIYTGTNDDFRFEIYGEKGALRFDSMYPNWLEFFDNTRSEGPYGGERGYTRIETMSAFEKPGGSFPPAKFPLGFLRSHVHSFYNFLQSIYAGTPGTPSFEEGAYILKLLETAYASAREGCWKKV